jgi:glyoxylase-like metal-dependent hydrolase (beta-lactamase superfamily II)
MNQAEQFPQSRHFEFEQLAPGVYAAIHLHGGWAIGNSGIIDLGDRTVVFDSTLTPLSAAELRRAAEELTGRPTAFVVNSHFHNDHIWGNQAFAPETDIVSTKGTLQAIRTHGVETYNRFRDSAATELERLRAEHDKESDDRQRKELFGWIAYHQGLVESLPALRVRPPNVTFEGRMTLQGSERAAQLIEYQGGHSPSDVVLSLPEEDILFAGDLLFIGCHPYLGGGNPDQLPRIIESLAQHHPKLLVPGHGPVGTADDLTTLCEYIEALDRLAQQLVAEGSPEKATDRVPVPEPYVDWEVPSFFTQNLRFLYRRLARNDGAAVT